MKTRLQWLMAVLMVLSMVLSACATPAAETVVVEEPTTAVVEQPTDVPPTPEPAAPVAATEEQLDAAYSTFLAGMTSYGSMGLAKLNEDLATDTPPFLLDVRETSELEEKGHIEGAVNIPLRELGANLSKLPSFDTTIVSYCGSGWRCTIAMAALEALGWEDVWALKENSFGGWVEAGYPVIEGVAEAAPDLNAATPDEAMVKTIGDAMAAIPEGWGGIAPDALNTALVENPELILIDVRTQAEIDEKGSIDYPNQIVIPLAQFIEMKADWPAKDAAIAVYCGSGHRSTIAATILWSYGYTDVLSMKGGYGAWTSAGFSTVGGIDPVAELDAAYSAFLADMTGYGIISLADLNTAIVEEPPFLLDVRTVAEVEEKGHIEGAVVAPLQELTANLTKLPSFDTPIVAYCGSGWRCTIAMAWLEALGWEDVKSLKENSFGGWVDAGYPVVEGLPAEAAELNAATPSKYVLPAIEAAVAAIPEGYGGIAVDALNTELIEDADLILIDVRKASEREEKGVIDAPNTTLHITLEEFIALKANWPAKDAKIVVYCGSGHRSTIAMAILWSYGYTDVRSMKGGFAAWVDAGFAVAEAPAQ